MEEYSDGLEDILYTFLEMFTDAPRYVSPDGMPGGFWVRSNYGEITVGAGPLPLELESADFQNRGPYIPLLPVARTVNAALTDEGKTDQRAYLSQVFHAGRQKDYQPETPIATTTKKAGAAGT